MPTTRPWRLSSVAATLAAGASLTIASAAQPAADRPAQDLDGLIIKTAAVAVRVSAIKGFVRPWALTFLPNGDMLVTEQGKNTLRLVRNGTLDPRPIAGLPAGLVPKRREEGGVDIALHPRFADNRLLYVAYWKTKAGPENFRTAAVVRARYDGSATLTEVREIFESNSWTDGPAAARLVFGRDGKIYLAIGAAGFAERLGSTEWAQDPSHHAGKVLRLNDDGTAPADNPFVGRDGYKPEIYALGIRNAIGLTMHPETGEIWETENGPEGGDEVNVIRAGENYGWPTVTFGKAYAFDKLGRSSGLPPPSVQPPTAAPGMRDPLLFYRPSIAISGMTFYTGDRFPMWRGNLIVGGLVGMQLSRITIDRRHVEDTSLRETMLSELRQRIRDVKQGPDGLIYVTTDEPDGAVLKIEPTPASRP